MEPQKPTSLPRAKRTKLEPEPAQKITPDEFKYAKKVKIGEKRPIGNTTTVETVGLGGLRVITHQSKPE